MNIVMLITQTGSRTGILAEQFHAGQQYDLTGTAGERELAAVFVREKWAKEVTEEAASDGAQAEGADTAQAGVEPAHAEAKGRRKAR